MSNEFTLFHQTYYANQFVYTLKTIKNQILLISLIPYMDVTRNCDNVRANASMTVSPK